MGKSATIFCHFDENLSVRCQYCFLFVNLASLWWKIFCQSIFHPSFLDIERKFIGLCSKLFQPSWRHCFLRVQGINLRVWNRFDKYLFVSFFFHLRTMGKKIKALFLKTIGRVVKTAYHVSKGIRWRFFLEKDLFLFHHWALSEFFYSFVLTFVGRAVSTAFCLSIAPVFGEILFVKKFFLSSFSDIDRNFIGLCSNFFQPSWRHCSLRVRKINLKTDNCFDKLFCHFFHPSRTLNQKIKVFLVGNQLSGLSNLLTICEGDPWKSFFFE